MRHPLRKGFTLIELLVVIAIIAILAAILFPVFAQARAAARKTTGLSNLKQIGNATMMYTQDYDERFPSWNWGVNATDGGVSPHHPNNQGIWPCATFPYVKNVGVWQDPSDRLRYRMPDAWLSPFPPVGGRITSSTDPRVTQSLWISYGWSESLEDGNWEAHPEFGAGVGFGGGMNLAAIQYPAENLMVSDGRGWLMDTWSRFGWTTDLQVRRATYTEADWIDELGGGPYPPDYQAAQRWSRHTTGSNVAFADGHAKFTPLQNLICIGPDNSQIATGARRTPLGQ
jgi:prepilin-type N-terminal cleavage/methylation domain-containing protein/prepilin-type processing-associated H-X9-DG protein